MVSLGKVQTGGRWLHSWLPRLSTDLIPPVLDHDDLTTLRAIRALHHEEALAVRGDVVVAARGRRLNEIGGVEEHWAIPKSATRACPPCSRMFSGLMSRCTTPRPCAYESASATSVARRTASATGSWRSRSKQLERHLAVMPDIVSQIDRRHATLPELALDRIATSQRLPHRVGVHGVRVLRTPVRASSCWYRGSAWIAYSDGFDHSV
jgi:hypothetical protein